MNATETFAKLDLCPCWFLKTAIHIMDKNYSFEVSYKTAKMWDRDNDKYKD